MQFNSVNSVIFINCIAMLTATATDPASPPAPPARPTNVAVPSTSPPPPQL
jgi:hypothetical protein